MKAARLVVFPAALALAASLGAGCYGSVDADGVGAGSPQPQGGHGADRGAGASTGGGGPSAGPRGLPCEIDELLAARCRGCHGSPPGPGVPMALVSYDDLAAETAGRSVAERALARMSTAAAPMPPSGVLPAAEVAPFEAWVRGGLPRGACGEVAGGGAAGGAHAGPPSPTVCTRGTFWTRGNRGSSQMHPGGACMTCHERSRELEGPDEDDGAPILSVGGTVYRTLYEPVDCNGIDGRDGHRVVVTDSVGREVTLPVNAAGNFLSDVPLTPPLRAKVVAPDGRTRAMSGAVPGGNCNGCHTERGTNGAPGRVMAP